MRPTHHELGGSALYESDLTIHTPFGSSLKMVMYYHLSLAESLNFKICYPDISVATEFTVGIDFFAEDIEFSAFAVLALHCHQPPLLRIPKLGRYLSPHAGLKRWMYRANPTRRIRTDFGEQFETLLPEFFFRFR
jgi:hypothetical protein